MDKREKITQFAKEIILSILEDVTGDSQPIVPKNKNLVAFFGESPTQEEEINEGCCLSNDFFLSFFFSFYFIYFIYFIFFFYVINIIFLFVCLFVCRLCVVVSIDVLYFVSFPFSPSSFS